MILELAGERAVAIHGEGAPAHEELAAIPVPGGFDDHLVQAARPQVARQVGHEGEPVLAALEHHRPVLAPGQRHRLGGAEGPAQEIADHPDPGGGVGARAGGLVGPNGDAEAAVEHRDQHREQGHGHHHLEQGEAGLGATAARVDPRRHSRLTTPSVARRTPVSLPSQVTVTVTFSRARVPSARISGPASSPA